MHKVATRLSGLPEGSSRWQSAWPSSSTVDLGGFSARSIGKPLVAEIELVPDRLNAASTRCALQTFMGTHAQQLAGRAAHSEPQNVLGERHG